MRTMLLKNNSKKINLLVKYSEDYLGETFNKIEIENLLNYKNKIDEVSSQKIWDRTKKLTNDYELIHMPTRKNKHQSIALYNPLSRSYFKMWEIIFDFKLISNENKKMVIACLAEGPGGFIEAINNYRRNYAKSIDPIYGITLKSENKDIPGWNKAHNYLNNNNNIKISYGIDNTGNLYNLNNILYFRDLILKNEKSKVDIITADGGFDFSINFNNQEQLSHRLIFCEIVTALTIQKLKGKFICKFFDIYSELSMSFIYILTNFYENVYITKPHTSRPANSEKYIVAYNFLGIDNRYLQELQNIVKYWDILSKNNWHINSIFEKKMPLDFISNILKYNTNNSNEQIKNIVKTLNYIENNKKLEDTKSYQSMIACNWCNKYKVKINKHSIYL